MQQSAQSDEISAGEIWPRYDHDKAVKMAEKGRGIGAWDRSVGLDWSLDEQSVSEGEINVMKLYRDTDLDLYA